MDKDRRMLLKGLATMPFTTLMTFGQSHKKPLTAKPISSLQIVLDGPFAIVLLQKQPNLIQIFTPVDPENLHAFFINGTNGDNNKKHIISLVSDPGAITFKNAAPDISDSCLTPFSWHSKDWDSGSTSNLVEMSLPSPDKIICDMNTVTGVTFENGAAAISPAGHILQYTVADSTKNIKINDSVMGDFKPDPVGDSLVLTIDVGRWTMNGSSDPDPHGSHAVTFHNSELTRFPSIKDDKDKRLASVGELLGPLFRKRRKRSHQFRPGLLSTAVECKTSGFIVTVP